MRSGFKNPRRTIGIHGRAILPFFMVVSQSHEERFRARAVNSYTRNWIKVGKRLSLDLEPNHSVIADECRRLAHNYREHWLTLPDLDANLKIDIENLCRSLDGVANAYGGWGNRMFPMLMQDNE